MTTQYRGSAITGRLLRLLAACTLWWAAGTACAQAVYTGGDIPAGWNLYFTDIDQDSYGDPNGGYLFPDAAPPSRVWAPWGNDPDDGDVKKWPLARAREGRVIALDIVDLGKDLGTRITAAREIGATVAWIELRWNQVDPGYGQISAATLAQVKTAATALQAAGIQVALSMDAIDGTALAVPTDLSARITAGTLGLGAKEVTDRAIYALSQLKAQLGSNGVTLVRLGRYADLHFATQPNVAFWTGVHGYLQTVGAYLHASWGSTVKVGLGVTHTGLTTEPTRAVFAAVNAAADVVITSFAPYNALQDPRKLRGMVETLLAARNGKPLVVWPLVFASSTSAASTEMRQSQMLRAFFDTWDAYADVMPLVLFSRLDDLSTGSPWFDSIGLRSSAGKPKAAFHTLRNMAFERGWWTLPLPAQRKFHMGFTQAPYDAPPTQAEQNAVADWIDGKIAQHGDLLSVHLDGGIPWTEALNDGFTTLEPPYANSVLNSWRNYAARRKSGQKLLLSINPLGIPRNLLAPYWGIGQGFTYDAAYNRIPDGVVADSEHRMPPAPFDTANFDDPAVKMAFLKYAIRAISWFNPDYLCIGIEVSATEVVSEDAYRRWLDLHKFVYTQLKAIPQFSKIKIFVSISATTYMADEYAGLVMDNAAESGTPYKYDEMPAGIRPRLIAGVKDLLPYVDILALSVYPHYGKYNAYTMPASAYDALFTNLKAAGLTDTKPLAVTESGYTADPYMLLGQTLFAGTADKQDRHMKLMLYELSKLPNPVDFVVNFQVRDSDMQWKRMNDATPGALFVEFYQYFRDIGLYDGDGNTRPSLDTWKSYFNLPIVPTNQ
ncbi:MAG: hypothetical protein EPO12_14790 [Aquabacterium sp.]|nr:MAG: hypothetical protein EPO12_14790 [Aquabacterium sp.]